MRLRVRNDLGDFLSAEVEESDREDARQAIQLAVKSERGYFSMKTENGEVFFPSGVVSRSVFELLN